MKKLFFFLLLFSGVEFSFAQKKEKAVALADGNCKEDQWELEFEENFEGSSLDLAVWKMREYSQGSMSTEGVEGYYTLDNILIENGICKIIPKKETLLRKAVSWQPDSMKLGDGNINLRTYNYTSAWIETRKLYRYGKFEVRCKIPKEKGFWPSFWMYGMENGVNNEIDVFEFWNEHNSFGKFSAKKLSMVNHMTMHYNKKMSSKSYTGPDYSTDFHTFAVVWDTTKIEWYVDGKLQRTATQYVTKRGKNVECKDIKSNETYYLNPVFPKDPMNIIANLAIQTGKNKPLVETFSNAFEIDYIRYYKPLPK
ncbi:MAG TPA: glycoside hydrolase family 16 protein [Bacteroidia bacterium]|jgi:beta-glucanase (GH16 family)